MITRRGYAHGRIWRGKMKVIESEIKKTRFWCLGALIDFTAGTDRIWGEPKRILSLWICFLRWAYYLEIHTGGEGR